MVKITHLTSAHPRYDTRIYHKICRSLTKHYSVSLVVADGLGDEVKDDIDIYDVGKLSSRLKRVLYTTRNVFKKAIKLDSDIYHIHDPELTLIGLKLKKLGKKVIFDAHEDVPKQIMAKHYLNTFSKGILSFFYSRFEIYALKKYDYVVSATPIIRDKFLEANIRSININNFPILDEFIDIEPSFSKHTICYIGLLYKTRGIIEIVEAIEDLDITLIVAGRFFDKTFEDEIKGLKGWSKVDFRGFASRDEVKNILKESIAGLVTLYPTPSYIEAYPVKMFEYMSSGIGVIASDFAIYKDFVEDNSCGICVNPLDIKEITKVIDNMITDLDKTKQMGINGKKAILEKYNWGNEEILLFELYERLLNE